ncbi:MAG: hypothetical protein NT026_01445 [Candidatus Staskawiczbacteria bacterium]|nr:hypothetical protein [Candidatus Staskawiczbacteria bacterium]
MKNLKKQPGQASRLLLVLAAIVLVAVIITYLILRMTEKPPAPKPGSGNETPTVPVAVYEKQLEDIDFIFKSALDRGEVLKASEIINSQYSSSYQKDLQVTPGGRFIQVTVGAKNMGTQNIERSAWDIGNIVDAKGRIFVPDDNYVVAPWLSEKNACGALLRPAFEPTSCTKIYEVSQEATGLKINVEVGQGNNPNNFASGKTSTFLLDLIVN